MCRRELGRLDELLLLFRFCLQVKEMCRRELDRLDTEVKRSNTIIADYKQVGLTGETQRV